MLLLLLLLLFTVHSLDKKMELLLFTLNSF